MIKDSFVFDALLLVCVFGLTKSEELDLECVPLRQCPELFDLFKANPRSQSTILLLQASHCGFDGNNPKVWCSQIPKSDNCTTPEGQLGVCTPVKKCEFFLRLLKTANFLSVESVSYLQGFQCNSNSGSSSTLVCCPTTKESFTKEVPLPLHLTEEPDEITEEPIEVTKKPPVKRPFFFPKPSTGECGQQLVSKIIGGTVTEMEEFPWTALLLYQQRLGSSTACAGTLISNRYVVTAAHCTDSNAIRAVGKLTHVILGEFDTRNEIDCINKLGIEDCADPPIKVPVESVILQPQWYTRPRAEINHDIALLRLAEKVKFTDYIKPICLPTSTLKVKEKHKMVVTGWGQTQNGQASFVKLKTTVPMANRNLCMEKYKVEKGLTVGEGEVCVGGEEGKDSCSGDSGGPLMIPVQKNGIAVWFLVGIVSFGSNQPCGIKDFPALYTYIPKYIEWIYETVEP